MQYANIIIDHKAGYDAFTYEIPAPLLAHLAIGSVVLVPLGRSFVHGVVVDFVRRLDHDVAKKLKPIKSIVYDGDFVAPYLLKAVSDLKRTYNYGAGDLLYYLLPEFPKRGQSTPSAGAVAGKGFNVIEYILPVSNRRDACLNIFNRLAALSSSLLILCPSYAAAQALHQSLASQAKGVVLYPQTPTAKERRDYFLSALTTPEPTIYIGPRGAIATPLHHIGGIFIDEPWFPGHKDERVPKLWSAFTALSLAKARNIPLYIGSSFPWPETQLLSSPKRYTTQSLPDRVRLVLHRSIAELLTQFLADNDDSNRDLAIVMRETTRDSYWCPNCRKEVSKDPCPDCQTQALFFPKVTRESVAAALDIHHPKSRIAIFLPDELFQYRQFSATLILGFDPYLSITDFRATIFLASLVRSIASQTSTVLMSTRHLDAWTEILQKDFNYFTTIELEERKSFHLPPFATAVQLTASKKESLQALTLDPTETIQAGSIRFHNDNFIQSLLLKRPGAIPASWQKSNAIKVDILPNYIE